MKIFHIVEVFLIFIILTLINYIFDAKNLFYIHSPFNIYLYALAIISLFYGFLQGILFYILYFLAIYIYYYYIDINIMSHYFIFLTIFSEFMYYWNKKINRLNEENSYLKQRVEELGSAYYLLKISHDELEKHYILKPFSIREMLKEIRELTNNNLKKGIKLFLQLLEKRFFIEQAGLFLKEGDKFILKGYIKEKITFEAEDILIKEAIEQNTMTYVAKIHNKKSNFLAVIPIISLDDKLKGVFVIKEMPFFSLTKDNLITISLFLTYLINLIETIEKYKNFKNPFLEKDLLALRYLSKKFKANNYLIIFYIKSELETTTIQHKLRGTDISYKYKNKLIVMLPFTPFSGVLKFCDKIKEDIVVNYKIFNLYKDSFEEIKKAINE